MEEILLLLVVFGTNVVQALTGFAGTLLAMPLSIKLVGIDTARIVLNFVSLFGSAYIMIVDRKNINWKAIKVAAPWLLAGMIAAPVIYSVIDTEAIIYIYGAAIILISLWKMFVKVQLNLPEAAVYLLVTLAGIAQGLVASGGPFLVVYMSGHTGNKSEFRTTICTVWVFLCSIFVFQNHQMITTYDLQLSALTMLPLFVSLVLGNLIHKKISQEKFMKVAYVLLLFSGISSFL